MALPICVTLIYPFDLRGNNKISYFAKSPLSLTASFPFFVPAAQQANCAFVCQRKANQKACAHAHKSFHALNAQTRVLAIHNNNNNC